MKPHIFAGTVLVAAIAIPLAMTIPGAALAQRDGSSSVTLRHEGVFTSDPLMRAMQLRARPGTFYFAASQEREIVRNPQGSRLAICLSRATSARPGWSAYDGAALSVRWDGGETVVHEGECAHLRAARIVLRPAAQMPAGAVLTGRVVAEG